ncbi:MAG TPA: hypothetical protein ENK96_03490 [Desulfobulbaceae bacterium]|nr:hypothetical protein [Desulfobulbaceae bacterium]
MSTQHTRIIEKTVLVLGLIAGLWAVVVLVGGTPLIRHFMVVIGILKPLPTEVDYYTHIKGIEYLICVVFFVVFPLFFRYVNKEKKDADFQL